MTSKHVCKSCSGCSYCLELNRFLGAFVNRFVGKFVDKFVNGFVVSSWTRPSSSPGRRVNCSRISLAQNGIRDFYQGFHDKIHQLSRQSGEMIEHSQKPKHSMRKSTATVASLTQCLKHRPRRRVHKNTSMDWHVYLILQHTVHARINPCSPESIQGHTGNDMRISKRTIDFELTSCTSRPFISLSLLRPFETCETGTREWREEHGMLWSHRIKILQC